MWLSHLSVLSVPGEGYSRNAHGIKSLELETAQLLRKYHARFWNNLHQVRSKPKDGKAT
jgi:hypothetical protein